ncbi:MAG: hypothetical protein MMC33_001852 [Icmadophila ericetorum]|nr:hypothetical protein [Icmadophila ericetorum]
MLQTGRGTLRLVQRLRQPARRRYADSTHPPGKESGHSASAGHHGSGHHSHGHSENVNEHFGRGFYLALASIPLTIALYKFSSSGEEGSLFTRLIKKYGSHKEVWTARNDLHTSMVEQAAHDRNLFQSTATTRQVELRFPEVFNTGSPYNVPAGHSANLDQLIQHYHKKNEETLLKNQKIAEKEAAISRRNPNDITKSVIQGQ